MNLIKAIYSIPNISHLFFVIEDDESGKNMPISSEKNKENIEYFLNILYSKHYQIPNKNKLWKIKLIRQCDFLSSVLGQSNKKMQSKNRENKNYLYMGSLAIFRLQFPETFPEFASQTYHFLSPISQEDIIEVFI